MHKNFAELINWASANYDLVIIDTPPVLAVTDAAIIGRYVGTTLLVARFERTQLKKLMSVLNVLNKAVLRLKDVSSMV